MAKQTTKKEVTVPDLSGMVTLIGTGVFSMKKGVEYTVTATHAKTLIKKGAGEVKQ